MSIKDLFKKNQEATQILKSDSIANISKDAESSDPDLYFEGEVRK